MKTLVLLMVLTVLLFHRCYYDSEEYLFPDTGSGCDTTNVTFSGSVKPIIQNNCLSCHANNVAAALGGNVKLQDYSDVKLRADDGKLVGTISHAQGYVTMPQGAPKLDECTIATVRLWVENGAAND